MNQIVPCKDNFIWVVFYDDYFAHFILYLIDYKSGFVHEKIKFRNYYSD